MRCITLLITVVSSFLVGCSTLKLDPVWVETRSVKPGTDAKKTVNVPEGMVFYNSSPATRGIRFPAGVYILEAEDADYFYLHSPAPLEFRILKDGKLTDERKIPGGLMMAKRFSMVPAAGYIDGEKDTDKMAVWKLGSEFLAIQGKYWTKSF
jgi:hypothetical protein